MWRKSNNFDRENLLTLLTVPRYNILGLCQREPRSRGRKQQLPDLSAQVPFAVDWGRCGPFVAGCLREGP
jgi:hypothetical protein